MMVGFVSAEAQPSHTLTPTILIKTNYYNRIDTLYAESMSPSSLPHVSLLPLSPPLPSPAPVSFYTASSAASSSSSRKRQREDSMLDFSDAIRSLADSRIKSQPQWAVRQATSIINDLATYTTSEKVRILRAMLKDKTIAEVICSSEGEVRHEFVISLLNDTN